jgi:hypothetical protein
MTVAFGFISLQDLFNQRIVTAGPQRVFDAVKASADEYTRVVNALLAEFANRTTDAQTQVELPGDGSLQPLDADGNPLPVAPSGSYTVAFPIQGAGTAWGTNRITRALMTVEEAARATQDALQKDADWNIRHLLAALLDNASWTFKDEAGPNGSKGLGNITIQPLANNDSVIYVRKGSVAPATDNHYLAQAAAIADITNPYETIETELLEHPSNTGRILCYIPTALKATTIALSTFKSVADPNVAYTTTELATNVPQVGPGEEVLGYIEGTKCWIVLWSALPSDIILAKMEGKAVLKMREYPAAQLQGFFPEQANVDGNHFVNRMLRYCGYGVEDRVGALVYRIGNAAYAIPTGYDAPLPA